MEKLTFAIEKMSLLEEINNSQFVRARVWAFASGENAHGVPVLESALHKAEQSIYEKPLVWKYNKLADDAGTHEVDQVPCGFVPRQGANIAYERTDCGRLFFVTDVLLWKFYSGRILDIFAKTENKKSVSVEIAVLETSKVDNKECISEFSYLAITVLGEKYNPAIPGANVTLQFSQDKTAVEQILRGEFSTTSDTKDGDKVIFNKDEHAKTFSLSASEMWSIVASACNEVKYQVGDELHTRYWMRDYDAEYVYAFDEQEHMFCGIPYTVTDGKVVLDFDNVKPATMAPRVTEEEGMNLKEFAKEIMQKDLESMFAEISSYKEKTSVLEAEKENISKQYAEALEAMESMKVENTSLKEFKASVEQQEMTSKMEYALNSVAEDLTQDQMDEWRIKFAEYANVDEFGNALKAFAWEVSRGKSKSRDSIVRVALPDVNTEHKTYKSIWEKY